MPPQRVTPVPPRPDFGYTAIMHYALIMAGGSGTRLWPLSRRGRPKQLLRLIEGRSLLQIARERLAGLFPPEHIWVITSGAYIEQVAEQLPDVPRANLIGEPVGRDTANAIGLAARLLIARHGTAALSATMAVFTADHLIQPQAEFESAVQTAQAAIAAQPEALVTFGIRPRAPHTGYGYLQRGEPLPAGPLGVCRVREFREKPDADTARAYLASGDYCWNSGMFCWRVGTLLAALDQHLPENSARLERLAADWPRQAAEFAELPRISIDYGVLEKSGDVFMVATDLDWTDLGSYEALASLAAPDAAGNVACGAAGLHEAGGGNWVYSEGGHLVVTLGVSDLVIVHSPDATLVCRKDMLGAIRDLAKPRVQRFGSRYE